MEKVKRITLRSWFYFRTGYGTYLSLAVGIVSNAIAVYYLAVQNIPFLQSMFPRFSTFLVVGLVSIGISGTLFGWLHYKRALRPFYKAEQDILVETNPYATEIISPVNMPLYKILSELARKHEIDTSEIDAIIKRTEKRRLET